MRRVPTTASAKQKTPEPSTRDESKYAPARSVRIHDDVWSSARERAKVDGITISEVINRFVEGYAEGHLAAPQMRMVYSGEDTKEAG